MDDVAVKPDIAQGATDAYAQIGLTIDAIQKWKPQPNVKLPLVKTARTMAENK